MGIRGVKGGVAASHVLAAWGGILLVAQAWTWIGYFTHGPTSVEPSGPFDPLAYWGARGFQVMTVIIGGSVVVSVVRAGLRERRVTFDLKFCIAGLLTYWCDPMVEFFQPIWFNSSYFINVRDWTAFIPFIVNPDAGRELELPVAYLPIYSGGFLGYAMLLNRMQRTLVARIPGAGFFELWCVGFVAGAVCEIIMEIFMLKLHLISYPGAPDFLALYVGDLKMPWVEWFTAGLLFGTLSTVRYYVDDRGQRVTERGLDGLPKPARGLVSTVAMIAIINSLLISVSLLDAFIGLYASPYRPQPPHLINDSCDLPGEPIKTRYGPCPGSPGYRMPLKGSLEGANPLGPSE